MSSGDGRAVRGWVSLTSIAALAGIWFGLPGTPVQASACGSVPEDWAVPELLCSQQFRKLRIDEASVTIDTYLGKASGSAPHGAYQMLSEEIQSENPGFVEGWSPIIFADRVQPLEPVEGALNEYRVTYVAYDGEGADVDPPAGDVNTYEQVIGLTKTGSDVEITRYDNLDRIASSRVQYYREHPRAVIQSYDRPDRGNMSLPSVQPTTALSLLCQLERPAGQWWSRTGWGWVSHADLEAGEGPRDEVPACGDQDFGRDPSR